MGASFEHVIREERGLFTETANRMSRARGAPSTGRPRCSEMLGMAASPNSPHAAPAIWIIRFDARHDGFFPRAIPGDYEIRRSLSYLQQTGTACGRYHNVALPFRNSENSLNAGQSHSGKLSNERDNKYTTIRCLGLELTQLQWQMPLAWKREICIDTTTGFAAAISSRSGQDRPYMHSCTPPIRFAFCLPHATPKPRSSLEMLWMRWGRALPP
jgi:hypothetical protein